VHPTPATRHTQTGPGSASEHRHDRRGRHTCTPSVLALKPFWSYLLAGTTFSSIQLELLRWKEGGRKFGSRKRGQEELGWEGKEKARCHSMQAQQGRGEGTAQSAACSCRSLPDKVQQGLAGCGLRGKGEGGAARSAAGSSNSSDAPLKKQQD
jgi:hypothetical protein